MPKPMQNCKKGISSQKSGQNIFVTDSPLSSLVKDQFIEAGESLTSQNRCFQMDFMENGMLLIRRLSGDCS
jgi:hypothetical protein